MDSSKARLISVMGVASLAALAACGTSSSSSSSSNGGGGDVLSACKGSVTVASDLPTSGSDASDGIPTQNGAQLAVNQANATHLLGGCTVKYIPMDDASVSLGKHDPQLGAQNITGLVGNDAVAGVVGPFNSNVALNELPIANRGGLPMISPSNTNPGLTIAGSNPDIDTSQVRPTTDLTYFRVCTTDIGQGHGLAQVALTTLHSKIAYVIDDQETYGKGLADEFEKDYKAGGSTTKRVSLPGSTKDFKSQLSEAKGMNADLIFFGGTSSNGGGIVRKQMADVGLPSTVSFMGGDGIVDDEFFVEAGATSAEGAYGTIAAPDPTRLTSAAQFVKDYNGAFGKDPGAYSANAYDAMNIILQAIKKAVVDHGGLFDDSKDFRTAVRTNIAKTDYNGAIGHTTFDKNGDTTNALLTLEVAKSGKWAYSDTIKLTLGA